MADRTEQRYDPKTGESFLVGWADGDRAGTDYASKVAVPGVAITLLAATVVNNATTNPTVSTAVTGLGIYSAFLKQMKVSAKSLAGGGTLNVLIQGSIDAGTTWFDVISSTQITNAAVANGTYHVFLNSNGASIAPSATAATDGTLTAASLVSKPFGDRLRVKLVPASFGANDVVTVAITAWMVP